MTLTKAYLLRVSVAALALTSVLVACLPNTQVQSEDSTAPRVVGIEPAGRSLHVDDSLTVTFSEPMNRLWLNANSFAIVETQNISDSLITDLNSPPLGRSHITLSVSMRNADKTVVLTPDEILPASSELSLLVSGRLSDLADNPLVGYDGLASHYQYDFITDDGAPTVSDTDLPTGDPAEVAPNLRGIRLSFDQPVFGVDRNSVTLVASDAGTEPLIQGIEIDTSRTHTLIRLADLGGPCFTLCPGATYTLVAGAGITDVDGVALVEFHRNLSASLTADLQSPRLLSGPSAAAAEDHAEIRWQTDEPSTSVVRLGDSADNLSRRVIGEPALECEGTGSARTCDHRVVVEGLNLGSGSGRTYYYAIESLDTVANPPLVVGPYSFTTRILPKLVINELYPNPPTGPNGESEKVYEFVEIYNASPDQSYDLSGFSLRKLNGSASMNLVAVEGVSSAVLPAQSYAVVGSRSFDPSALGVPSSALLLTDARSDRSTLLSGLDNGQNTRKAIGLFEGDQDDAGAPLISSYSAPLALYSDGGSFTEGVSAERLSPEADDVDTSWCYSQGAPTPGADNSVLGLSACP